MQETVFWGDTWQVGVGVTSDAPHCSAGARGCTSCPSQTPPHRGARFSRGCSFQLFSLNALRSLFPLHCSPGCSLGLGEAGGAGIPGAFPPSPLSLYLPSSPFPFFCLRGPSLCD